MAESKYTAPNDFRAFCEILDENQTSMAHHGVKGQKWGERKYQDYNGKLTALGRQHYGYGPGRKGKHGDTGENENAQDESDKKIAEITKNYEFNKEYSLRDPLVKKAISIAKSWDAERSNELHIGEEENRKRDLKTTIGKGAAIGAAAGSGRGLGIATASIINENNMIDQYNKSVQRMNTFTVNQFGKTVQGQTISRLTNDEQAGRLLAFGAIGAAGGAALGAGVGGIIHGVRAHNAKRANDNLSRTINEIYQNPNVDKKTGLKTKRSIMSPEDDMAKVNPGFKNWSDGTKSNCLICTATYALRRKGFDVTANGANDGYDTTAMLQAFPKATMRRVQLPKSNKNNELSSILNMPEGGFGNMSVSWKAGGGHSMVVSVEGGRVVIRDTQSNKTYRGAAVNKILSRTTGEAKIIRLDNADPDIAQMKKMGMINPLGQSFKFDSKTVTQNVSGEGKKGGKHGDTGLMNNKLFKKIKPGYVNYYDDITGKKMNESYRVGDIDEYLKNISKKDIKALRKDPDFKDALNVAKNFRKTGDIANAVNELNKISKVKPTKTDLDNVLKATYPSRYDGKRMGLSSDLKLERITPNYERPDKSSAFYSSTIKNGGRDVKIYIDVPASGGGYKYGKIEERVKVATRVATNKDFLKEVKTKKEMLLNDVNEQDAKQIMKTAYVAWVDVNSSGENGYYGLRGYKMNGNKEYMEGQFMTLPNGKIVPLEPHVTELD